MGLFERSLPDVHFLKLADAAIDWGRESSLWPSAVEMNIPPPRA